MKILETFGENRPKFVKKWKINIWRMISIGQGKLRKLCAKYCAFGPKMKKILKNEENFEIFDQNLYGNWHFSHFLTKYFLDSDSSLKYIPLEDNTRFLQQYFPISGEGWDVPAFSPLPILLASSWMKFLSILKCYNIWT